MKEENIKQERPSQMDHIQHGKLLKKWMDRRNDMVEESQVVIPNYQIMTKKIKKDNKILLEYRTKYYFISCVLDILEEKKNLQQQDKVGAKEIYSIFLGRYSNMDTHWNITAKQLEIYLLHMRWMGLIGLDKTTSNWGITLTDAGKNAFQSQIYHSIAANLYYSKKTEKLSKVSLAIAVVSMLIALAALIWGILT